MSEKKSPLMMRAQEKKEQCLELSISNDEIIINDISNIFAMSGYKMRILAINHELWDQKNLTVEIATKLESHVVKKVFDMHGFDVFAVISREKYVEVYMRRRD